MQFKLKQIEAEFLLLGNKNPALKTLLEMVDKFIKLEFNKEVTITHIFRTPEQHKALYAQTANPPATSPHEIWEAADLRSSIFSDDEIQRLLAFLNTFRYKGGQRKVAIFHAIAGNVNHFHIQYGKGSP